MIRNIIKTLRPYGYFIVGLGTGNVISKIFTKATFVDLLDLFLITVVVASVMFLIFDKYFTN